MFEIIKNADLPKQRQGSPKYPFAELEVGDAFDVPSEMSRKVRSASSHWAKNNGRKLTCRELPDGSLRVYRAA